MSSPERIAQPEAKANSAEALYRQELEQEYGRDTMDAIVESYREAVAGNRMTDEEIEEEILCDANGGMNKFADVLDTIAGGYGKVLDFAHSQIEARRESNRGPPESTKSTATEGGVKGSRVEIEDKYYARQIDQWDGKDHGGAFRVGKVSKPLLDIGVPDADIWFDQSKAATQLLNKEEITKDVLKQIPSVLEKPVAISESYDNTVMVFGHVFDDKGNPIVVALRVNSTNRRNHITLVNKIRSVGTRSHNLDKLLSEDSLLYLSKNKKETAAWFNALGRSTPFGGTKLGLIRSISFQAENSNRKIKGSAVEREDLDAIQRIGRKSVSQFTTDDIAVTERYAKAYYEQMGEKSPFFRAWFGDWRANDQAPVFVAAERGSARGVQRNDDTGWNINVSGKVFNETKNHTDSYNKAAREYLPYINDIVKKAVLLDSFAMEKKKSPNSLMMHSLYAVADIGSGKEVLKLYVEEMNDPNAENTAKRAYQLQNVEKYRPVAKSSQKTVSSISATGDIRTVADLFADVKSKDSNFKPNTASKVVNDDGTPKVVHHGTDAESIHVFQNESGAYWFSESEDYAEAMAEERGGGNIMRAYLDIKKPYHVLLPVGEFSDPVKEKPYIRYAKEHGYDGVIFETDTDNELVYDKFYVVFDSTQIKSATENVGTFGKNNPDIRFSAVGTEDLKALEKQNDALPTARSKRGGRAIAGRLRAQKTPPRRAV